MFCSYGQNDSKAVQPFEIGDIVEIHSSILDESRILNIYLPNGYKTDSINKLYPVIYLLDGSKDEDFIHISGLVQFGSFSWINMIPESIVVGIANTDRKRDFTAPTTDKEHLEAFPTTGGSEKFISFIENELQPYIDNNYRTTSTKTIIGQSLGGLLTTEILFTKPNLFNNYLIVSPSLWWKDEYLLDANPELIQTDFKDVKNIFVAVGGDEDKIMIREAQSLFNLIQKSKNNSLNTNFEIFENQNHGDILHIAAYKGLKVIFNE